MGKKTGNDIIHDIVESLRDKKDNNAFLINDQYYTYEELGKKVSTIISYLSHQKDEQIGVVANDNIETYASILAILISGKTYVILHPSYPQSRNLKVAELADLHKVLLSGHFESTLFAENGIEIVNTMLLEEAPSPLLYDDSTYDEKKNAYIIFTSGSTGEPKGVPISRKNLNAFYNAYSALGWTLDEHDRMLQMFELTFDISVVSLLYPLAIGACVYTVGHQDIKYIKVFDLMEKYELTFAAIAPSLLHLISPYFDEITLSTLKYLIVSAEASQVDILERFRSSVPNAELINLYGPTEATIYCTYYRIPPQNSKHYNGMTAIGKPFNGIEVLVTNDADEALPIGEQGELWVSGNQVMEGYLNAPQKSAEALVVAANGKTYYRTGDSCILDADGDIIYCGRKDSQVKIQGFRIELSEIEYTGRQFFNNTRNVIVIPIVQNGVCNELQMVVEATECDEAALLQHLKANLPPYMIPKKIHCLALLPTNNSNKVDRKKIAQLI